MITVEIQEIALKLETDSRVFSPSHVDAGTLAMLARMEWEADDKVLDLGCGCGVVGILAAKKLTEAQVLLCDICPAAVELSRVNAALNDLPNLRILQSDVYSNIDEHDFTAILSNPPYHADFSVAKRIIEGGFQRLVLGGRILMVTKRREWYEKKLTAVFGGVSVRETGGYYVFLAQKRTATIPARKNKQQALSRKLQRKAAARRTAGFRI